MTRNKQLAIWLSSLQLFLLGCGDSEHDKAAAEYYPVAQVCETITGKERARDAAGLIRSQLEGEGIAEGYDVNRKSVVFVSTYTRSFVQKDFQSLPEVKHKVFEAAYLEGMVRVSCAISQYVGSQEMVTDDGSWADCAFSRPSAMSLYGAKVLASAESYDGSRYMMAVAVAWSKKLCDCVLAVRKGEKVSSAPGSCTLDEWVENQQLECMVGTRTFVDADGRSWLVAVCAIPFEDACRYCMARDSVDVQCRSYES